MSNCLKKKFLSQKKLHWVETAASAGHQTLLRVAAASNFFFSRDLSGHLNNNKLVHVFFELGNAEFQHASGINSDEIFNLHIIIMPVI